MPELIITDAGRQAAIDANNMGLTVRMARIAVGTGQYTPVATQTALQTQVAVADIARGLSIGADQLQVSARFTAGAWDAYELGVFLDNGTLFAVGSSDQAGDFPTKEAGTDVVVTVTLLISDVPSGSVTVEATIQTTVPKASTREAGIAELADESDPETDDERVVTPALLKTRIDAIVTQLAGIAPAALDTIAELAAALKNNPNIIQNLLDATALRARLDGADFTGDTQGLTRPQGDDTGHFATTAFVRREVDDVLQRVGGVVLSDGFDLAARTQSAQAINVAGCRWIELMYSSDGVLAEEPARIPVGSLHRQGSSTPVLFGARNTTRWPTLDIINPATSRPTPVGVLDFPLFGTDVVAPTAMESHDGMLYIVDTAQRLYRVNTQTAVLTLIDRFTDDITSLASFGGVLYAIDTAGQFYSVNTATAALTLVRNLGATTTGPIFAHSGTFYLWDYRDSGITVYSFDPVDASSSLSSVGSASSIVANVISLTSHDGTIYLVFSQYGTAQNLVTLDLSPLDDTFVPGGTQGYAAIASHSGTINGITLDLGADKTRLTVCRPGADADTLQFTAETALRVEQVIGIR